MRRSVVLPSIIAIIALFGVLGLTACQSAGPTAQTGAVASAVQPAAATPSASAAAKPVSKPAANPGGTCNEKTIPAYHPDFSRGPLPGGGLTPAELTDRAQALPNYLTENWGVLGLPSSYITVQIGVICPSGDIYIKDNPTPLARGAELLNSEPNGGAPAYPGGHLWSHPAAEAIGGVPCQALIQIDMQSGLTEPAAIAAGIFKAACSNNGAFWHMGHPDGS
jgi:hypothetical protein